MTPHDADEREPGPELLAAHLDGELDAGTRAWVSRWLSGHPEAAAEVEALRKLDQDWQGGAPEEPVEHWDPLLERIAAGISTARIQQDKAKARKPRSLVQPALWLAATAASILLLFLILPRQEPRPVDRPAVVEAFPVAAEEDVEIISMKNADQFRLVVGNQPLPMAELGDVFLIKVEADKDGMLPQLHVQEVGDMPMIVAPLQTAREGP